MRGVKAARLVMSFLLAVLLGASKAVYAETLSVLSPSEDDLKQWESKSFEGETQYMLERDSDGASFLRAISNASASGLFLKQDIDINEFPYLNWEWRSDKSLAALDEQSKSGDDYVARMYVVVDGGLFFWNTIALNYVWSSSATSKDAWPNAFAGDNAQMVPVKNASSASGTWYTEKRNLKEDFKAFFGKDISRIDAIAIMTDTDNSKQDAQASYRNIYFSKN